MNIAILLTCHNRREKTLKCIENLHRSTFSEVCNQEIFLVDDGCTDHTADFVRKQYSFVHIIKGDGSLFWNRGMRLAWEEASKSEHDYYLWLNDDTDLFYDSINRLLNCSNSHNDECIIVGSTYSSPEEPTLSYGGRTLNGLLLTPKDDISVPCDMFNGNIVLIPNFVFNRLGYNDNYFRHSFGDFEYGLRAKKNGIQNYIAPGYYGYCKRNNPVPLFRRKCYNVFKRYKLLYSPLGFNPFESFHLNIRYYSIKKALFIFVKLHINVLFTLDHSKY